MPAVLVRHPRVAVPRQDGRAGPCAGDGEAPVHARQAGQDRPVANRIGVELEDRIAAALGRQVQRVGRLRAEPDLGLAAIEAGVADDRQDARPVAAGRLGVGRLRRAAGNRARRRRRSARPPPGRRNAGSSRARRLPWPAGRGRPASRASYWRSSLSLAGSRVIGPVAGLAKAGIGVLDPAGELDVLIAHQRIAQELHLGRRPRRR